MKIRILIAMLVIAAVGAGYFFWSLKDRDLKMVPYGTDALILIDVKEVKEQYIFSWLKHPSQWFRKRGQKIQLKRAGVEIPDFIQIFHLKDTSFAQWYCVLKVKDRPALVRFLTENGFKTIQKNVYKKDEISVKVSDARCIFGFSNSEFDIKGEWILKSKMQTLFANNLINNSVASLSYFGPGKIHKFGIYIQDNSLEIKSKTVNDLSSAKIEKFQNVPFLQFRLDEKNVKIAAKILNQNIPDSVKINAVSGGSTLEEVNDKVVTYSYDENFNEVETVRYQKLVKPNYRISFMSEDPLLLQTYFKKIQWINPQNQFTAIPFQPNSTEITSSQIIVTSVGKSVQPVSEPSANYLFLRNSSLLTGLVGSFSRSAAATVKDLDYLYYGNGADYYTLKLKFKNSQTPLILR